MTKKPFTTRLDPAIVELAKSVALAERRSLTSVIEIALLEYSERRGFDRDKMVNAKSASKREDKGYD